MPPWDFSCWAISQTFVFNEMPRHTFSYKVLAAAIGSMLNLNCKATWWLQHRHVVKSQGLQQMSDLLHHCHCQHWNSSCKVEFSKLWFPQVYGCKPKTTCPSLLTAYWSRRSLAMILFFRSSLVSVAADEWKFQVAASKFAIESWRQQHDNNAVCCKWFRGNTMKSKKWQTAAPGQVSAWISPTLHHSLGPSSVVS